MEQCIYNIKGVIGKNLQVFENKVIITVKPGLGSFLSRDVFNGEKTIYYSDVIGVQFKKTGGFNGYLQLETASSQMDKRRSNSRSENSFAFNKTTVSNEKMEEVAAYVKERVEICKQQKNQPMVASTTSPAEELKQFKNLLDAGVIIQEEFDAKKKQLLGI